jgi:protein TonB
VSPRIQIVADVQWLRDSRTRFIALSVGVHVLLAVTLILMPSLRASTDTMPEPLVVDLVAAAPAGPPAGATQPAPPAPPPPAPPPSPPDEGVRVETRDPPPADPIPDKPKPEKKPPPKEQKPEPAAPAPPRPAPPVDTPPPENPAPGEATAGPSGPPAEPGSSITAMQGGDSALAWYRSSVTGALYTHWRKPIVEGRSEAYEVRVVFEILRDGSVRGLEIDRSSGIPSLDRSALRAVSDASPLPPLPRSWREPVLSAGFVFRLIPD